MSRVEGLTDAVLALAMTLLIVSLEVPGDFNELLDAFKQLPAFLVTFGLLLLLWFYHFQYHRRFGLENFVTIALNGLLLFLLLFYVYPLKFMFTVLFDMAFLGGSGFKGESVRQLMVIYSGGYVGIFGVFVALYAYALKHEVALELTPVEVQVARGSMREHAIHVAIGLASVGLALMPFRWDRRLPVSSTSWSGRRRDSRAGGTGGGWSAWWRRRRRRRTRAASNPVATRVAAPTAGPRLLR